MPVDHGCEMFVVLAVGAALGQVKDSGTVRLKCLGSAWGFFLQWGVPFFLDWEMLVIQAAVAD